MKKHLSLGTMIFVSFFSLCCGGGGGSPEDGAIGGRAEDLWGNVIDLSDYSRGLTVLHPFSPADCGYCLFDEEFAYVNYGLNTLDRGGAFFGMSLFCPQLDNYTYSKHYRAEYPLITFPPDLHRYHKDGFPWIIAFKDGELIFSDGMAPYEKTFVDLRRDLWGEDVPLEPTSNSQLGSRFIWENNDNLAVAVIADERPMPESTDNNSCTTKREGDLTDEDLRKNLLIRGRSDELDLEFLDGKEVPVEIGEESFVIGDFEFPKHETGISACFPNPYNVERYLMIRLVGKELDAGLYENWTDFTVYRDGADGKPEVLMNGLFEVEGDKWRFSRAKTWVSAETMSFCKGGKCPSPFEGHPVARKDPYAATDPISRPSPHGRLWTLGESDCRFPSLAARPDGSCLVAWEEAGDIALAELGGAEPRTVAVEEGPHDSFNPVLAVGANETWVFYLSDQDGFYRLYGSYGRPAGPFSEVRLSGDGAMDSVTPAAVGESSGDVTVAWSEWKANQRYLMYRRISGRMLGETRQAAIKSSDIDYTNAWYASLAADPSGGVWGAWNQHYPLVLGVAVGDLVEEAANVSEEFGGYPSIAIDPSGTRWVVWESYMRNVIRGKGHRILAAYSGGDNDKWSIPEDLSARAGCRYNQTPEIAAGRDGALWVAWSGRADDGSPWGIYVCRSGPGGWSEPVKVSADGENARAPAMSASGGSVWLAWHSGVGSQMKIKALRYEEG